MASTDFPALSAGSLWCEHERCLTSTKAFSSGKDLADHTAACHTHAAPAAGCVVATTVARAPAVGLELEVGRGAGGTLGAAPPAPELAEVDGAASWNTFRWIPEGVLKVVERRRDPSDRELYTQPQFERYYKRQSAAKWAAAAGSALTSYSCHCRSCKRAGRRIEFVAMDDALAHLEQHAGFRFVACRCGDRIWDKRLRAHVKEDH